MIDPNVFASVSREIDPDDTMYVGNLDHYLAVGQSALRCIDASLTLADAGPPKRILDLPCGHGRILRALRVAYPAAQLTACDLDRSAVDFCVRTFGALGVYSHTNPAKITLSGPYDLIWCGSLFTHLPGPRWKEFLQRFEELLSPAGVALFTTHGRVAAGWLERRRSDVGLTIAQLYGLTETQSVDALKEYNDQGLGYVRLAGRSEYGFSLSALPWVISLVQKATSLRLVACLEHGWDNHQDVIACAKTS